jgi:hypothetical protein
MRKNSKKGENWIKTLVYIGLVQKRLQRNNVLYVDVEVQPFMNAINARSGYIHVVWLHIIIGMYNIKSYCYRRILINIFLIVQKKVLKFDINVVDQRIVRFL